jgi:hypothetical protein
VRDPSEIGGTFVTITAGTNVHAMSPTTTTDATSAARRRHRPSGATILAADQTTRQRPATSAHIPATEVIVIPTLTTCGMPMPAPATRANSPIASTVHPRSLRPRHGAVHPHRPCGDAEDSHELPAGAPVSTEEERKRRTGDHRGDQRDLTPIRPMFTG